MWQGFEHDRAGALALDALANTHPIYAPVRSVAEATENFDAITYEKGAAVVRMIEHYLGADTFRAGVRTYMRRHREQNAVAADLWRALEEASGREVSRVAQAWIEQPGFPLVSFAPRAAERSFAFSQERFFSDPRVPARTAAASLAAAARRQAPGNGRRRGRPLLGRWSLASRDARVRAAHRRWFYGNADAGGFYRVCTSRATAGARREASARRSRPSSGSRLVGDQWALVRAARRDDRKLPRRRRRAR